MLIWKWLATCNLKAHKRRQGDQAACEIEQLEVRRLLSATELPPSAGTATFADGWNVSGAFLRDAILGDLDSDGDLDAFGIKGDTGGTGPAGDLKVFLNDGTANFASSGQDFQRYQFGGVALGDVDGDSDLDAIATRSSDVGLASELWLNDGHGEFSNSGQNLGTGHSYGIAVGDLDDDGDLDAVIPHYNEPTAIWRNDGGGHFSDSGQRLATGGARDAALGDLDGDGDLDAFIATNRNSSKIWFNNGTGAFSSGNQNFTAANGDGKIVLGDLDDDGDLDACLQSESFLTTDVLINDGTGHFQIGQRLSETFAVALGDLDGDHDLDVFAGNDWYPSAVLLNDGSGRMSATGQVLTNTGTPAHIGNTDNIDIAIGDVDGDGDLDAFAANPFGSQVFLNENPAFVVSLPIDGGTYELVTAGDDLVLRTQTGDDIFRQRFDAANELVVLGLDGDDTLTVDFSGGNPIRVGGIMFDGGAGNDRVVLTGGSVASVTQAFSNSSDGRLTVDDRAVVLRGMESISDQLEVTQRVFQFGDGPDAVTLADDGSANNGMSQLSLAAGMTIDFAKPSGSLSLGSGGGDDIVTLAGTDALLTVQVAVFGEDGNDALMGLMASDSFDGGAGNDVLNGRGGNDTMLGGDGRDTLVGGAGHDSLAGGSDNDKLSGQAGNDSLDGGVGDDLLTGDAGRDLILGGDGNDKLLGDEGHDTLLGEAGRDVLSGGLGNDELDGGADNDYLLGEDGNDSLLGLSGNDVLLGGTGRDTLQGGDGKDSLLGGSNNDVLLGGLGPDTLAGNDGDDIIVGMASEIDEAFSSTP